MDQVFNGDTEEEALRETERRHGLQRDEKGVMVTSGERGGLTEADIHKAIDVLFEHYGKAPTQTVLRNFIKKGSYGPVNKALNSWEEKQKEPAADEASASVEVVPLPGEMASVVGELVGEMVDTLARRLWEAASRGHAEQIASERTIMEGHLEEARQEVARQIETADAVQALLDEKTEELETVAGKLEEIVGLVEQRDTEIEAQRDELSRRDGRIEELERERNADRTENGRLNAALSHSEGEIEKLKALLQGAEQRVKDTENNAKKARTDAETQLNDLRLSLANERLKADADREAAERREKNAASEIDGLKKEKAEFKRAIDAGRERAERDLTEAKAEAKRALAEQAATYEDRLTAAKSEAAAAQQLVASLSEQIAMLKNQADKQGNKPAGNTDKV